MFALVSMLVGLAQSVSPPASSAEYKAMLTDSHTGPCRSSFLITISIYEWASNEP